MTTALAWLGGITALLFLIVLGFVFWVYSLRMWN